METLEQFDSMAASLLEKMPQILEQGMAYGGDLFIRFISYAIFIESAKILLGFIILYVYYKLCKYFEIYFYNKIDVIGASIAVGLITLLPAFVLIINTFPKLIQAIFIPELYILNYFN